MSLKRSFLFFILLFSLGNLVNLAEAQPLVVKLPPPPSSQSQKNHKIKGVIKKPVQQKKITSVKSTPLKSTPLKSPSQKTASLKVIKTPVKSPTKPKSLKTQKKHKKIKTVNLSDKKVLAAKPKPAVTPVEIASTTTPEITSTPEVTPLTPNPTITKTTSLQALPNSPISPNSPNSPTSPTLPNSPKISKNISSILAQYEKYLDKTIKDKKAPGCAIAIVYKNQVIFMKGYGVRRLGKPDKIDADTVFQLGSVSKPVASTLVAVLQNQGLLNINDPVDDYLPKFALKGTKDPKALKIKHVLSHSTGLSRAGFNNMIESHSSHACIIRALQTTPVRFPIGKRYDYNNAMYSLIGEITMSATRRSFQENLTNYLLKPLNMSRTSSTFQGLMRTENRACPHVRHGKKSLHACQTYSQGYYTVAPAGGINSSVRDMATFLKAQMGAFPGVLDKKILSRLHQPIIPTPKQNLGSYDGPRENIKNAHYGLGWRLIDFNDRKLVFHGGWLKGFTNFIAFIPEEQIGIVVLHNAENKFSSKVAMRFFDIYLGIR